MQIFYVTHASIKAMFIKSCFLLSAIFAETLAFSSKLRVNVSRLENVINMLT